MKYKRLLLKLSGEALMGNGKYVFHSNRLQQYAEEVKKVVDMGGEVAIVIGGGNIFRGFLPKISSGNIHRIDGDYMGMLATVINGIAFQSHLENVGISTYMQTAIRMDQIAEPCRKNIAIQKLEKGNVVIFVAGLGHPYFTTDTAAVLRAIEIKADVLLKGTKVDGIYTKDPKKNKDAKKLKYLSFEMVCKMGIRVMDQTAFILGSENNLPIVIFDINKKENFKNLVSGKEIGTLVSRNKRKNV
ncbi:UMP kinase [Blattabacterium cuenoti]|uniref:UMP kinase n=1 Tax=Blattabacterium cuenoti TaxID=1653831 RepID=UPI00163C10C5|nr:UMP kinase [Blattabacterium cuenoti]